MEGWIKYYRCIEDDEIWQDPHRLRFWLWLLSHASYKDGNKNYIQSINMYIPVNIGQLAVSQKALADKFGVHRHTLSKWLEELTEQEKIMTTTIRKYTIITVINYKKYQFNDGTQKEENNRQVNIQDNNQINSKLNTFSNNQYGQVNGQVNGQLYNIKERKEAKNNNYDDDASEPQILNQEELALAQQKKNESDFNALPLEDKQRKLREYAELTLSNPRQVEYLAENVLHDKDWGKVQDFVLLHRDTMMFEGKFFPSEKAYTNHLRRWKGSYDFIKQNKNYKPNGNKSDQYAKRRGTPPSPLEEFNGESF